MNQRYGFKVFFILILFLSIVIFILQLISLTKWPSHKKFAYVFYITDPEYACYAGINADRLIDTLHMDEEIDILFMYTSDDWQFKRVLQSCSHPKVKLIRVPNAPEGITENELYAQSYVRFEAFKLRYDRLVILDADGLILKNLDHLFRMPLDGHQLAATYADYTTRNWISSVMLIVEPSRDLYEKVRKYLTPDGIREIAQFANGSHFDMDILNYVFAAGRNSKLIPANYVLLDSYILKSEDQVELPYYVHFTMKKPTIYVETRRLDYQVNEQGRFVYKEFWTGFDRRCSSAFGESLKIALNEFEHLEESRKKDEALVEKIESDY